jgi:hypothetical protein
MSGIDFAGIEQQAEAGSSAGGGGGAADSAAADLPATQPLSGRQLESVIAGLAAELPVSLYAPDQCREFAQMLCYLAIHNFNTQSCALVILELLALSNHYKKSLLLGDGYQQPVHMPILQSHMGAYEAWCGLRAICWPAQLERDMCAVATILADVAPLCVRVRAMHVEQKLVLGSRVRGEVVAHMEALIENICTYEKHRVQANAFRKGLMLGKAMLLSEAEPALQVSLQPLKDALNSLKAEQRQGAVRERVRGGLSLAGVEEEGEDEVHTPGSPGADATL